MAAMITIALAACGNDGESPEPEAGDPAPTVETPSGPPVGSLEWALAHELRTSDEIARDTWLKPKAIVETFELSPDMTIYEPWPGTGYLTAIMAPWATEGGGTYIAALPRAGQGETADSDQADTNGFAMMRQVFWSRFEAPDGPLSIQRAPFPAMQSEPMINEVADAAISIDDVHAWMALGQADVAFTTVFQALKPGGRFVVIEARGEAGAPQDPGAITGYVQPRYVIGLAQAAGFTYVRAEDGWNNPADTADHPFGVWTLAPFARTSPFGEAPDPVFDRSSFDAIGEPRRMALLFEKPAAESDEETDDNAVDEAGADDASDNEVPAGEDG